MSEETWLCERCGASNPENAASRQCLVCARELVRRHRVKEAARRAKDSARKAHWRMDEAKRAIERRRDRERKRVKRGTLGVAAGREPIRSSETVTVIVNGIERPFTLLRLGNTPAAVVLRQQDYDVVQPGPRSMLRRLDAAGLGIAVREWLEY